MEESDAEASMFRNSSRQVMIAAAAAAISMTGQAQAGDFTHDECRAIAAVASTVIKRVGPEKLSVQFRQSLLDYIALPKFTCDGSKNILTPTGEDAATFATIMTLLEASSQPIYLQRAGLRSVDPAALSADRPADPMKRSDVGEGPKVN